MKEIPRVSGVPLGMAMSYHIFPRKVSFDECKVGAVLPLHMHVTQYD